MFTWDAWKRERDCILRGEKRGYYRNQLVVSKRVFVLLAGLVNVVLGIILTVTYLRLWQVALPYPKSGTFVRSLPIGRSGDYKMYIQLSGFYQTYLRYTKSISTNQLKGKATQDIDSCDPLERDNSKIIYPCGLIANSFFQDDFRIEGSRISAQDITWESERDLIKPTTYSFGQIVAPPLWTPYTKVPDLSKNYRLINWLSLAPFPTFRKLYGRVSLKRGVHTLTIKASYPFGTKAVVFSETSWAGTRNLFLSIFMISLGATMCTFFILT